MVDEDEDRLRVSDARRAAELGPWEKLGQRGVDCF